MAIRDLMCSFEILTHGHNIHTVFKIITMSPQWLCRAKLFSYCRKVEVPKNRKTDILNYRSLEKVTKMLLTISKMYNTLARFILA